jgi:Rrf2 family transcriptional regulator, iron-sulfur cluster assembly transcription factor
VRLEITRRADLATRALVMLTTAPHRTKAAELADRLGTTTGFVAQVMAPLVGKGWVRSEPGPTGGYVATVASGAVSVLDVIEAVDGPTETGRCVLEDRPCSGAAECALHRPWARARGLMLDELAALSLSDLAVTGAST